MTIEKKAKYYWKNFNGLVDTFSEKNIPKR
jgi:hypothetical protein